MGFLMNLLEGKKWGFKYSLYRRKFENVEVINEVKDPKISVIVISWRLHPLTLRNLQILKHEKEKINFELIFVDNGGRSDEFDILKTCIDTYIRLNENTGACIARNIGALFSKTSILLFLEDDSIPDQDLIASHAFIHSKYNPISVEGVYLPYSNNPLNEKQKHYYHGDKFYPLYPILEGNASFNAEVFFEVGGWDDDIKFGGEGKALAIKIWGYSPDVTKQIYSPISIIYHDYATNYERLDEKLLQQKKSFDYLSEKYPLWESFDGLWTNYQEGNASLKETEYWKSNLRVQEEFSLLKTEILARNRESILAYMTGKVLLHDKDSIKELYVKLKGTKSFCIFGTGEYGLKVQSVLMEYGIEISCFVDNDNLKWGKEVSGISIIKPSDLHSSHFILIASTWSYEISEQLEQIGFKRDENFKIVI